MFWTIVKIAWLLTGPMGFVAMFVSACIHEKKSPIEFLESVEEELKEYEDFRELLTESIKIITIIAILMHMLVPILGWRAFIKDWRNIYHNKEPSN